MLRQEAIDKVAEVLERATSEIREGDIFGARWSVQRASDLMEDKDILYALGKKIVYEDNHFTRRMVDIVLDDIPIEEPGKFEGQKEIARWLYETSLDGGTCEDFSNEFAGWFFMVHITDQDIEQRKALGLPGFAHRYYIVQEADNGFVTVERTFDDQDEAYRVWEAIVHEMSEDED